MSTVIITTLLTFGADYCLGRVSGALVCCQSTSIVLCGSFGCLAQAASEVHADL